MKVKFKNFLVAVSVFLVSKLADHTLYSAEACWRHAMTAWGSHLTIFYIRLVKRLSPALANISCCCCWS